MKTVWVMAFTLLMLACNTQRRTDLKTEKDSISYTIGMDIGKNLKSQSIEINQAALAQGINDVLSGDTTMMSEQQAQEAIQHLQQNMREKQEQEMKEASEKNKKEGEAFLAENRKKEGVVTLPSGLQYKIITVGTGRKPKETQTVTVHYRGTLIDGTEFDSSYKRGQPATFPLNGVIKGWVEALQAMSVGSKWELFIPPDLAYGEPGYGQVIGPNKTLIFEVELLSIK